MDMNRVARLWETVTKSVSRAGGKGHNIDNKYIPSIDLLRDIRADYSVQQEDSRLYVYAVGCGEK